MLKADFQYSTGCAIDYASMPRWRSINNRHGITLRKPDHLLANDAVALSILRWKFFEATASARLTIIGLTARFAQNRMLSGKQSKISAGRNPRLRMGSARIGKSFDARPRCAAAGDQLVSLCRDRDAIVRIEAAPSRARRRPCRQSFDHFAFRTHGFSPSPESRFPNPGGQIRRSQLALARRHVSQLLHSVARAKFDVE